MLFNSLQYAIFLPIVFILYWAVPHKYRWGIVLASSYYFYMSWNAKYLLLIVFITFVSWLGALLTARAQTEMQKKQCVAGVVTISLGLLFVFKYFNFVVESLTAILHMVSVDVPSIALAVLLPVGISFYTFQSIGYVVDVYRGDIEAEKHFGKYAAFVAFFPQLVAGPIERSNNLLPQLKKEQFFDYDKATYGLKLMAWGYFKKIVIADTLAMSVDKIYADIHGYSGFARFAVIFFFSIQIYCDFSGYSDIARGTAKLFGIDLMENFKSPYFSASIREFWRRWHISLSSWFRDYLYIPLGGNRVSKVRNAVNLMITFLCSGLWHGASWTFVTWGGLHGGTQIAEKFIDTHKKEGKRNRIPHWVKVVLNFILVSAFWTFFRAQRFKDAAYMLVYWYRNFHNPVYWIVNGCEDLGINGALAIQIILMLAMLFVYDYLSLKKDVIQSISKWSLPSRWAVYIGLVVLIFFWAPASSAEFIYFDF